MTKAKYTTGGELLQPGTTVLIQFFDPERHQLRHRMTCTVHESPMHPHGTKMLRAWIMRWVRRGNNLCEITEVTP